MKCPKKNKNCKATLCFKNREGLICGGINKKPTKYKKDIIKLCLKGKYVKDIKVEMTSQEALMISSVLSLATSEGINNG